MLFSAALLAGVALLPLSSAQVSDGFESGWNQSKWPAYANDCDQGGTVSLDNTVAHTGKHSMKVTGGQNGYCGHKFFGTTQVLTGSDVYVRTWMRHAAPLTDQHVTFITMLDSSQGAGKHLRLSGQAKIFEYNRETDDATLPSLSPTGIASSVAFPTGSWHCLEYHLSTNGTIQTWFNGTLVPGLTIAPGTSNPNMGNWGTAYKPKIKAVYFGWESYSGSIDTVWYDDVAISAKRIGCA